MQNHGWTVQINLSVWVKILQFAIFPLYMYFLQTSEPDLIIAGDFNAPDFIWTEALYGQVKCNPSYSTAVNFSLLDLYNYIMTTG